MFRPLKNINFTVLTVILLVGASTFLRFYNISSPPFDAHSLRQTQTLSTIADFHENGVDLLYPKTHYAGYPGYFALECPLYQAAMAWLWNIFPHSIAAIRFYNILIGIFTGWLLYLIANLFLPKKTSAAAAIIFLLAPLNIFCSRSILLEPTGIFLALTLIYLYFKIGPINNPKSLVLFLLFSICLCVSALIKALYLFPLLVIFAATLYGKDKKTTGLYAISFSLALFLLFLWMAHANAVNNSSIFLEGKTAIKHLGCLSLFNPLFWPTMAYRAAIKIAPGPAFWLLLFSLFLAFFKNGIDKKSVYLLRICWVIILGFLCLFADINLPHDYYQLILTPFTSLLIAFAAFYLLDQLSDTRVKNAICVIFAAALFLSASIAYLETARISVPLLEFQAAVGPRLGQNNRFVFLFAKAISRDDLSKIRFNKPPELDELSALYSVNKWGVARRGLTVQESIAYLKSIPRHLRDNFGEIIFYGYVYGEEFFPEELATLGELGYKLKTNGRFGAIFKRI